MTNEEKILARLDELHQEVKEAKQAIRPYVELKRDLEPLVASMVLEAITKLDGLDRRVELQDVGDMLGQLLASSATITEALQGLERFMEFKRDIGPYTKPMFSALVSQLQVVLQGFEGEDLKELLRQLIINMANLADALRLLGGIMEFRQETAPLASMAFNDLVQRLECLKERGVFAALEQVLVAMEKIGSRLEKTDLSGAAPVRGALGMMAALRRPEVQEGLGVLVELSTVMAALKEEAPSRLCRSGRQEL